jgi:membrane protein insertase Oxa1/YidC/SpoIIIJ
MQDFTVYIIPVLYVISSILSIKITTKMQQETLNKNKTDNGKQLIDPNKPDQEEAMLQMTKNMNYIMPIMTVSIAFIAPLGLALYWFVSNIWMIAERFIIKKFVGVKEEK